MDSLFTTFDHLEYPLVKSLQDMDGTFLDPFFRAVSDVPSMIVFFSIIIVTLFVVRQTIWKPFLIALIIALAVHVLVNEGILKDLLQSFGIFRPRPYMIHPDILAVGFPFQDSSFPSSHMAFTTLIVVIVTYFERRFLFFGILIILMMGLSRVHNGMHYPTDVLMGIFMGLLYGFLGLWSMRKLGLEKKKWWSRIRK